MKPAFQYHARSMTPPPMLRPAASAPRRQAGSSLLLGGLFGGRCGGRLLGGVGARNLRFQDADLDVRRDLDVQDVALPRRHLADDSPARDHLVALLQPVDERLVLALLLLLGTHDHEVEDQEEDPYQEEHVERAAQRRPAPVSGLRQERNQEGLLREKRALVAPAGRSGNHACGGRRRVSWAPGGGRGGTGGRRSRPPDQMTMRRKQAPPSLLAALAD